MSRVNHLKNMLTEIKASTDEKTKKQLDLDKWERIIERLGSFSDSCKECEERLLEMEVHLTTLQEESGQMQKDTIKKHDEFINRHISHLQKEHKLVTEGTYLSIYLSLGVSLGIVFGLALFENIALGMPIGMCIGLAIGVSLDADAKKKGKTI